MRFAPRTLKGQLTLFFLLLALVPAAALTGFTTWRLLQAMERWEQPGIQEALTGSFEVARDMMNRAENDLLQRGQLLAADPVMTGPPEADRIRARLAEAYNLDFVQLYDSTGRLLFEVSRDPLIRPPGKLAEVRLTAARDDPFLRDPARGLIAYAGFRGSPTAPDTVLVAGSWLGGEFYPRLEHLSQALGYYRQLRETIKTQQRASLATLGLVLLAVAVVSVVLARALASRVSGPVESLGRGMLAMTEASEPVQVAPKGSEEMERLITTFNTMSLELSRSRERLALAERQAAWREVARRVAHEMKNALTPISFSLHRVRKIVPELDESDRDRFTRSLDTVLEEVEGLRRLASSFSELARLPAPEMGRVDLTEITASAVRAASETSPPVQWAPPAGPIPVRGDATLLRQAVVNLIRNACEAAGPEGAVWVAVADGAETATVTVDDDGPGWPEDRERVLEPYMTTKPSGTGLGLSLVQRTALQHGGGLELADRPGGGARVVLTLPRERS